MTESSSNLSLSDKGTKKPIAWRLSSPILSQSNRTPKVDDDRCVGTQRRRKQNAPSVTSVLLSQFNPPSPTHKKGSVYQIIFHLIHQDPISLEQIEKELDALQPAEQENILNIAENDNYGTLLHFVCGKHSSTDQCPPYAVISYLLSKGAKATNRANRSQCTPLHYLVRHNVTPANSVAYKKILASLLAQPGSDIDVKNSHEETPLHNAIMHGNYAMCIMLIEDFEANVFAKNKSGSNCLHLAVMQQNVDLVKEMLKRGIDPNECGGKKPTSALQFAELVRSPNSEQILKLILKTLRKRDAKAKPKAEGKTDTPPRTKRKGGRTKRSTSSSPKAPRVAPLRLSANSQISQISQNTFRKGKSYYDEWEIDMDKLELGGIIGQGSFGRVFRGTYMGVTVAVKNLQALGNEEAQKTSFGRFQKEIALMSKIQHKNIVKFLGASIRLKSDYEVYIVTEFAERGDLHNYLRTQNPPWTLRLKWCVQCAQGLEFLHQSGIIHRDLKTQNILIDINNDAKLADFGLSKDTSSATMTPSSERQLGTLAWASPELFEIGSTSQHTYASDVYSFGCLMYSLYSMKDPWEGAAVMNVIKNVAAGLRPQVAAAQEVSQTYFKLMDRCWDQSPLKRPTMPEVLQVVKVLRSL